MGRMAIGLATLALVVGALALNVTRFPVVGSPFDSPAPPAIPSTAATASSPAAVTAPPTTGKGRSAQQHGPAAEQPRNDAASRAAQRGQAAQVAQPETPGKAARTLVPIHRAAATDPQLLANGLTRLPPIEPGAPAATDPNARLPDGAVPVYPVAGR